MSPRPEDALARLARGWAAHWPDADHPAMAEDVARRLRAGLDRWGLRDPQPLPGGVVALVCAVTGEDGDAAVLKVHPRGHAEDAYLRAEAVALAHWQPTGVVPALRGTADAGMTLLLEHVTPGTTLDAAGLGEDERLRILGGLVRRLHATPRPPPAELPHLRAYAPGWAGHAVPAADDVVLHADLHGANALRDGADGWRVIDPHAAVGDRHADVWALIDPLAPPLPSADDAARVEAWRRIDVYADAAGLDPRRAASWVRARALVEAAELAGTADGADAAWAGRLRLTADALA